MANRNRTAGNDFERLTVLRLKESGLFPYASTSRLQSRARDNAKVDIMNADEFKHGRIPYDIQCKNYAKTLDYETLINELPNEPGYMPVIFHKKTKKHETSGRFMVQGTYALMKLDDFYELMKYRKGYEYLHQSATEEQKIELAKLSL